MLPEDLAPWRTSCPDPHRIVKRDAAWLTRTRLLMDGHVPEAVVTGHRALVGDLDLPDSDGRHMLAAAIEGRG